MWANKFHDTSLFGFSGNKLLNLFCFSSFNNNVAVQLQKG